MLDAAPDCGLLQDLVSLQVRSACLHRITYPGAHQWRRLLKRQAIRKQRCSLSVSNNILGKPSVVSETEELLPLADDDVRLVGAGRIFEHPARSTRSAGVFEQQRSDTLADLPLLRRLLSDCYDRPDWLVGRRHRQWGFVDALEYLVVGVAESRCADLHEEVVVADFGNWDILQLVRLVEMLGKECQSRPIQGCLKTLHLPL